MAHVTVWMTGMLRTWALHVPRSAWPLSYAADMESASLLVRVPQDLLSEPHRLHSLTSVVCDCYGQLGASEMR